MNKFIILLIFSFNLLYSFPVQITSRFESDNSKKRYKTELYREHNSDYLSLDLIAAILGFSEPQIEESIEQIKVACTSFDNKKVTLVSNMSYLAIEQKIYNLPYEVKLFDGKFYLPVEYFLETFNIFYGSRIFSYQKRCITIHNNKALLPAVIAENFQAKENFKTDSFTISDLVFDMKENGIIFSLFVNREFSEKEISISLKEKFMFITIYKATIDLERFSNLEISNNFIKKMEVLQHEESVQLNFSLKKNPLSKSLSIRKDKINIILPFTREVKYSDKELVKSLTKPNNTDSSTFVNSSINDKNYHVVILDPGHGGKDKGEVFQSGKLLEKNLNLQFSRLIAEKLKETYEDKRKKLLIKFTRNRHADSYATTYSRSVYANKMSGDLFVSIHTFFTDTTKSIDNIFYGLNDPIIFYPGQVESHREEKIISLFKNSEDYVINLENFQQRANYHKLDDYQYLYLKFLKIEYDYPHFITDMGNNILDNYFTALGKTAYNRFRLNVFPSEQYVLTELNIPGFQIQMPVNPYETVTIQNKNLELMAQIIAETISQKLENPDYSLFQ